MKYWCVADQDEVGNPLVSELSEQEILDQYWDYWYNRVCKKIGKEWTDLNCTHEDCINDWVTIHWAWESSRNKLESK